MVRLTPERRCVSNLHTLLVSAALCCGLATLGLWPQRHSAQSLGGDRHLTSFPAFAHPVASGAGPPRRRAFLALIAASAPFGTAVGPSGAATETRDAIAVANTAPNSPEDMFMQIAKQVAFPAEGGNSTASLGDGAQTETLGPLLLGLGGFFFIVVPLIKFLFFGGASIFIVRALEDNFVSDNAKTGQVLKKAVKRLSGDPIDLLEERKLSVVRLNDELVSLQAALVEQTEGQAAADQVRNSARRSRFLTSWRHALGTGLEPLTLAKVEDAVATFVKKEQKRRVIFDDDVDIWQNNLVKGSLFGRVWGRFRLAASQDQRLQLEQELVVALREALPKEARPRLTKLLGDESRIGWLADRVAATAGDDVGPPRVFVLSFNGDPTASGVSLLAQEITAVLGSSPRPEEVVLRITSPGGTVTGYGLAAAQLMRLRDAGVRLVACVDQLAASGGYLMACCADRILCSPFAGIGSIGVISSVPNATERLSNEGVKFIQTTAGKWKRTIDPFTEPTPEALEKAKEDIQMVYRQFADFVKKNRPSVKIDEVATGEVWFGPEALARGLVDELRTSADYLQRHMSEGREVLALSYSDRASGVSGALAGAGEGAQGALDPDALRTAAEALRAANQLRGLATGQAGADTAGLGSWPAGSAEPRFEARGPLLP